jgi:hypothetical protein
MAWIGLGVCAQCVDVGIDVACVGSILRSIDMKQPYAFRIFRAAQGERRVCWFEDTEYGLVETLEAVADMVKHLSDQTRPVVSIDIRIVPKH